MALNFRLIFIAFVGLAGCAPEGERCFTSLGNEVTEKRQVEAFTTVTIFGRVDVEFTAQLNPGEVEVTGGEHVMPALKTEVEAGGLVISDETRCKWVRRLNYTPLVRLPVEDISRLILSGSGEITTADTLRSTFLYVEAREAAAKAQLNVACDSLQVLLYTGYIETHFSGRTQVAQLYCSDATAIQAGDLRSANLFFNSGSIRNCRVNYTGYGYLELTSSGNVHYPINAAETDILERAAGRAIGY